MYSIFLGVFFNDLFDSKMHTILLDMYVTVRVLDFLRYL